MSTLPSMKLKPSTCKVCRQRKVRCDGENPCGPCSRGRKSFTCEYIDPSARVLAELPKGAACIQCWRRKRKCDGNRPCVTCKNSSQPEACQYREKAPRTEPGKEDSTRRAPVSTSSDTSVSSDPSPPSLSPAEPQSAATETLETLSPQGVPDPSLSTFQPIANTTVLNVDLPVEIQSSCIFALLNAGIPPQCEVAQDTELSSVRNLFLDHSWKYGINISSEKRAAIARGDISGSVVHPVFISVCQLLGYVIAREGNHANYAYLEGHWAAREASQRTRTLALLAADTDTDPDAPDPLTRVHVHQLLAMYSGMQKDSRGYEEHLGNASNVVLRHFVALGLEDDSDSAQIGTGFPPGAVQEGRSAFSHLVYLEVASKIIMRQPPKLPPVMRAKFHHLAVKNADEIELNFVRAKSGILLDESQQLVAEWNRLEPGDMVGSEWGDRWIALAKCSQTHLKVLKRSITEHTLAGAHRAKVLMLRSSLIVVLAAMAELHAVFAPFHEFARQRHSNILNGIASISRTLAPADHQYFDCTLEVCWGIASREISEPTEATPQWQVCFANAVFLGFDVPLQVDVCTGDEASPTELNVIQPLEQPLDFASLSL
ncbi:hypothetical protein B0H19DRAFT_1144858 [Mycena capillaripes]|nr:hypothetical protein B0H19DRAFT_1144858 [Mycena capillaripes]